MAKRSQTSRIARKGRVLSILYEYEGQMYRHVFEKPANMAIKSGAVDIRGDFKATKKDGILG